MITILLQKYGKIPSIQPYADTVLVTVFDESLRNTSLELASKIRGGGVRCICFSEAAKLQKQIKYADRLGMSAVLVVGPDEAQSNLVTIKDLKNRTQQTVGKDQVITGLRQILAQA